MKEKQEFSPVTITLESQEEVDKLYAVLNYYPIIDSLKIENWYNKFDHCVQHTSPSWLLWYEKMLKSIKDYHKN